MDQLLKQEVAYDNLRISAATEVHSRDELLVAISTAGQAHLTSFVNELQRQQQATDRTLSEETNAQQSVKEVAQ